MPKIDQDDDVFWIYVKFGDAKIFEGDNTNYFFYVRESSPDLKIKIPPNKFFNIIISSKLALNPTTTFTLNASPDTHVPAQSEKKENNNESSIASDYNIDPVDSNEVVWVPFKDHVIFSAR